MCFVGNLPTIFIYEIGTSIIIYENIHQKICHAEFELPTKYFVGKLSTKHFVGNSLRKVS